MTKEQMARIRDHLATRPPMTALRKQVWREMEPLRQALIAK